MQNCSIGKFGSVEDGIITSFSIPVTWRNILLNTGLKQHKFTEMSEI
jgi:hypothetical protein